jgi:hypothetical protein
VSRLIATAVTVTSRTLNYYIIFKYIYLILHTREEIKRTTRQVIFKPIHFNYILLHRDVIT